MQSRRAIGALYEALRGRVADLPSPPQREFDVSHLNDALDQLAAMWIALTLGNEDHQQMIRDIELVMRTVRSALRERQAVQPTSQARAH